MDRDYYGPEKYVRELTQMGGKNPFGLPMYRLVLIGKVTRKIGGHWEDWPASVPYEARHGILTNEETGKPMESPYKPTWVGDEVREVESYDDPSQWEMWLLERWAPASIECPREEWFAPHNCINGNPDIPKLGPYPNEGRYYWCCGPFEQPPSLSFLADMIAQWNQNRDRTERDLAKFVKQRQYEAEQRQEKREQEQFEKTAAMIRDALSPMLSTSLAAGRWRTEMAERAGFRTHIGN
jgi:hypothetical protein